MRARRSLILLVVLLIGVFLLINSSFVWKLMYPIKYEEQIEWASKKYGVEPYLVMAVIRAESKFDPTLVSKKGAVGLMQLMPDTANWIVEQSEMNSLYQPDLEHPETNIHLGTWYLGYLIKMFEGNEVKAIAAYNAGPGNVKGWLSSNRWDGKADSVSDIPFGETRHYVQRVIYYEERYEEIYKETFSVANSDRN